MGSREKANDSEVMNLENTRATNSDGMGPEGVRPDAAPDAMNTDAAPEVTPDAEPQAAPDFQAAEDPLTTQEWEDDK